MGGRVSASDFKDDEESLKDCVFWSDPWTESDRENLNEAPWDILTQLLTQHYKKWVDDEVVSHGDKSSPRIGISVYQFLHSLKNPSRGKSDTCPVYEPRDNRRLREDIMPYASWVRAMMEVLSCEPDPLSQQVSLSARRALIKSVTELRVNVSLDQSNYVDPLTGISTRSATEAHINSLIAKDRAFTVLYLDLSKFKIVNDTHGHAAGDKVLRTIAQTWLSLMRPTDWLGRWGGDEFIIAIPDDLSDSDRGRLVDRIRDACEKPVALASLSSVSVSTSAGYAHYPDDGRCLEDLLAVADRRLYVAKYAQSAKDLPTQTNKTQRRWQERIAEALISGGIEVNYQPIIPSHDPVSTHWEAFVRYRDRNGNIHRPKKFLTALGPDSLVRLDQKVIHMVFQDMALWHGHGRDLQVSINLDPQALLIDDWLSFLDDLHQEFPSVKAEDITFDIGESLAVPSMFRLLDALTALRDRGYQLALDDFGGGNMTLHRLQQLPVSSVKIDHMWTREWQSMAGRTLIQSVVSLSEPMGFQVIAEGVETEMQNRALQLWGCDGMQGWFYSRELSADEVLRFNVQGILR